MVRHHRVGAARPVRCELAALGGAARATDTVDRTTTPTDKPSAPAGLTPVAADGAAGEDGTALRAAPFYDMAPQLNLVR